MEHNDLERYGMAASWCQEFGLTQKVVESRLLKVDGVLAKAAGGQLRTFYKESDVRSALADVLQSLPVTDREGFFVAEGGARYGTIDAWAEKLGVWPQTLQNRLREVSFLQGRGSTGNAVRLYEESAVTVVSHDLLQEYPIADEAGFFAVDGQRYGTLKTWAQELKLSEGTLRKYLASIKGTTAKLYRGKIVEEGFYAESDVRSVCANLLRDLPRADAEGFVESGSGRYGTVYAWARALSLSRKALARVLASHEGITARDTSGRVVEGGFYPEAVIRVLQQEWEGLSMADESGFFVREETGQPVRYGTIHAWAQEFGLSYIGVQPRLKKEQGISGKDMHGRVLKNSFYSEAIARQACADLLENLPKAYAAGFLMLDQSDSTPERCGTVHAWSDELHVGERTIKKRLEGTTSVKGKDFSGRIGTFYRESDVRRICNDLLSQHGG